MLNLRIGKVYTFSTLAPAILGAVIKNAKLISIVDYSSALKYDNIVTKYRTIYPVLPNGTPDSPEDCEYYIFKTESGDSVVFANQWIDENTVELIQHVGIKVNISNGSLTDVNRIRDALNALGVEDFTITTF